MNEGNPEKYVGPWQNTNHLRNSPEELKEVVFSGPKSYSSFSAHKNCGLRYAAEKVWKWEKPVEAPSPALDRGNMIHNAVEQFFKGSEYLPTDLISYKQWMWNLRNDYTVLPEEKWAFVIGPDGKWAATDFDNPMAGVRGLWDLVVRTKDGNDVSIFEWKTGKVYDDHRWQRELYNTAAIAHFTDAKKFSVQTVYLDQKKTVPLLPERDMDLEEHKQAHELAVGGWNTNFKYMDMPVTYVPNPGQHCRFCPFSRYKGGKCKVG